MPPVSAEAMDSLLDEAAALCVCKVACSLLFLPSLTASFSPVSFCCCCILIFTDVLVSVFLTFLCVFEPWLPQLNPGTDVIALRALLFLCHTYGTALLLTTPLIAVDSLTRLLRPRVLAQGSAVQTARHGGAPALLSDNQEEGRKPDKDGLTHVVGYLCCLTVWIVVGLDARWRCRVEEVWTAACLQTPSSLIRCLPNLFSPMPSSAIPCWSMAFLSLLLVLGTGRREERPTHTGGTHTDKHGGHPANSGMSAQRVDPEKTESSCSVHRACSRSGAHMSPHHHGDFVLLVPQCLCAEKRRQQHKWINRGAAQEEHLGSQHRSPCGWRLCGLKVMTGLVGVLGVFVLPLNLSVSILLIRTIDSVLELCVTSLASSAAQPSGTPVSHCETLV